MVSVVFAQTARAELIEAQDWYEGEAEGLGRRFREAIELTVERIRANPRQFPIAFGKVRRVLVRRFPYSLFFVPDDEIVLVIACFHASRDPVKWRKRT